MNRIQNAGLCLLAMLCASLEARVQAVPVPNPVISYLFDGDMTPQHGSITGTPVGPGGAQTSGPVFSTNVPHSYDDNRSLHFDGTDDYATLGTQMVGNAIDGAAAITITGWFNYNQALGAATYDNVMFYSRHDQPGNSNIWLGLQQSGAGGRVLLGGRSHNAGPFQEGVHTSVLNSNSWHFFAGIMDYANNQIRIAVDGGALQTTSVSFGSSTYLKATGGSVPNLPDWISYGVAIDSRRWKGWLDEIAIFDTALTQAQIDTLYLQGLNPQLQAAPIPEPASATMLLVGCALLGRRSRKSMSSIHTS